MPVLVPLTQGFNALIDNDDWPLVSRHRWHAKVRGNTVYAGTNVRIQADEYQWTALHTLLMQPPPELEIDHIDGNGLNNTRSNLRCCQHNKNMANRRA